MQAFFGSFGLLRQSLKRNQCRKVQGIQRSELLFDESKDKGARQVSFESQRIELALICI